MTTEWLQNIKTGDHVVLTDGYKDDYVVTVEKVTPTRITVNGISCKFRKDNGEEICKPNKWLRYHRLSEATPGKILKIRESDKHKDLQFDISKINFKKLSISQLERIVAISQEETES